MSCVGSLTSDRSEEQELWSLQIVTIVKHDHNDFVWTYNVLTCLIHREKN